MSPSFRIALANLPFPRSPQDAVDQAEKAIAEAGRHKASVLCFPEAFVPGYRNIAGRVAPASTDFLERSWRRLGEAAARERVAVILGTERPEARGLVLTAIVLDSNGSRLGAQDKVQLDPSEEGTYVAGEGRQVFRLGSATIGVVICHEGWRYPETVRWCVRQGAQVVFHPQFHEAQPGSFRPTNYADPSNTFHEKAVLCRAAENTCYFATVNYAGEGSPTTSAVASPDGDLLAVQPYGQPGLLVADLDLSKATGLLARRYKPLVM